MMVPSARRRVRRCVPSFIRIIVPSTPQRFLLLALCSLLFLFVLTTPAAWESVTAFFSSDSEQALLDRYRRVARRHIQWMEESVGTIESGSEWNNTERCRNTVQGASRLADDRGYVCTRESVDGSGCCSLSSARTRFSCSACTLSSPSDACCSHYEDCVSCCMRPDQKTSLLGVIDSTRGHRLRAIVSARDQFELCSSLCRTSSISVKNENKYRDEHTKYCYLQEEHA